LEPVADRPPAPAQQSLQLILARNLISTLSTAAFIVDPRGTVVFYNEAAGEFLGMRYEETGKMPLPEWRAAIEPVDDEGNPVPADELPITVALRERRPVHMTNRIRGRGSAAERIEMLALPLIGTEDQHEGAVGVFWLHLDAPE
jgi:PAS domain-containing protein